MTNEDWEAIAAVIDRVKTDTETLDTDLYVADIVAIVEGQQL